ncbi:hypothetical protein SFC43_13920 [Bacteroides sp. CR5/BHMF/2]|nr:hypothetical protein [Bacteroides sp. CR5/BHMF/2]
MYSMLFSSRNSPPLGTEDAERTFSDGHQHAAGAGGDFRLRVAARTYDCRGDVEAVARRDDTAARQLVLRAAGEQGGQGQ